MSQLNQSLLEQPVTSAVVCALHCEAKPLIDRLKLKKLNDIKVFSVYQSGSFFILISGIGKQNMVAAVNWLAGFLAKQAQPLFCLNIGVAGHKTADIGELYCAHKISDDSCTQSYYPTKWLKHKIPLAPLLTVAQQEETYPEQQLYDMEGYAFYQAATRFYSQEYVQCLKVVADNQTQKVSRDKVFISALIEKHCATIVTFIQQHTAHIDDTYPTLTNEKLPQQLFQQHHFSHSQQLQFNKDYQAALTHHIDLSALDTSPQTQSAHILKQLKQLLNQHAVQL